MSPYADTETPLLEGLAPAVSRRHGRAAGGSSPAREPVTVEDALEDVCGRFCGGGRHDPVHTLLAAAVAAGRSARAARVIPSRSTDPGTSRRAEPRPVTAGNARGRLLAAFAAVGPNGCTDERAAELAGVGLGSEYAKRCSELREARYIEPTGEEARGASGKARIVCRVTHAGASVLASAGIPDLS